MTPVCTDTPNSARNPTPDDTLKLVPRPKQRQQAAYRSHSDVHQNQAGPLHRAEHSVENEKDQQQRQRNDEHQAALGALLAGILAGPVDGVSFRQLDLRAHLPDGLFDGAAQVASAHAILDGDIALTPFPIDFRRAVHGLHVGQLRQRDALPAGRQQADILDGFLGIAVLRKIAQHQVVALLTLENLGERVAAHRGLNGILNVGGIDLVARRFIAVAR